MSEIKMLPLPTRLAASGLKSEIVNFAERLVEHNVRFLTHELANAECAIDAERAGRKKAEAEIEALRAKLADTRTRHAATERDACQLASRLNGLERVVQERDAEIDALQADARRSATDYQMLRDFADRETVRAERLAEALRELVALGHPRDPAIIAAKNALRDHDQEGKDG